MLLESTIDYVSFFQEERENLNFHDTKLHFLIEKNNILKEINMLPENKLKKKANGKLILPEYLPDAIKGIVIVTSSCPSIYI